MSEARLVCYPAPSGIGWIVAANDQLVPGVYATAETAKRAASYPDAELLRIANVWSYDGEDRPATDLDLDTLDKCGPPTDALKEDAP